MIVLCSVGGYHKPVRDGPRRPKVDKGGELGLTLETITV